MNYLKKGDVYESPAWGLSSEYSAVQREVSRDAAAKVHQDAQNYVNVM